MHNNTGTTTTPGTPTPKLTAGTHTTWAEKRNQGIFQGDVEKVLDLFVIQETLNGHFKKRVRSYGEFENLFTNSRDPNQNKDAGQNDILINEIY